MNDEIRITHHASRNVVLDGSTAAEQHIAHAVAIGTLLRAEYILLRVIELSRAACSIAPNPPIDEHPLEQRRRAWACLERIAVRLRAQALCVRTHVVVGE